MLEPQTAAADVIAAAEALTPLQTAHDDDPRWSAIADPTTWTAVNAVGHISDALLFYSAQVARRAEHAHPKLRDRRTASPSEQIDNAVSAAHVLAGLLRDLGHHRACTPAVALMPQGGLAWPSPNFSFTAATPLAQYRSSCHCRAQRALAPWRGSSPGSRTLWVNRSDSCSGSPDTCMCLA